MNLESKARETAHIICANHSHSFEYRYGVILSALKAAVAEKDEQNMILRRFAIEASRDNIDLDVMKKAIAALREEQALREPSSASQKPQQKEK